MLQRLTVNILYQGIAEKDPSLMNPPPTRAFYRGAMVHPITPTQWEYWPDGLMVVSSQGQIEAAGPWNDIQAHWPIGPTDRVIHFPAHRLVMPGLIDLHVHLPQLSVTGCLSTSLLDWLKEYVFPAESQFEDPTYARAMTRWFFYELLKNGTTTAAVFLTLHQTACQIAFETALEMGNRVIMGQNLMDTESPDTLKLPTAVLLAETQTLCDQWHQKEEGRIQYAWMPRFALSCSDSLLKELGNLRTENPSVYCHTHLSEQPGEIAAVLARFKQAKDYTQVYEDFGLLGSKTLMAHAIHLSDGELSRLKASQTSLVHCPSSNFFLKSGRFPLETIEKHGLPWGLGSDVGAGPELSLFKVMKDAEYMQPHQVVSPQALLYRATLGGAEALMMGDTLGNFVPGKAADFIVLDCHGKSALPAQEETPPLSVDRLISQIIFLGDDRLVSETYIRGQRVYRRLHPPEERAPAFPTPKAPQAFPH